ncbi:MAG TPA: response regulator [Steroidobacteraceae bacterium]|jgi:PAS domain S-box-containing protein|nr:response regulator [Steroidobacteraceae bacterium]
MNERVKGLNERQTILVVDDNAASLYATSRILRAADFTVIEAVNGTDALALATPEVDLIVLDINLPDIDGLEVCRQLRARSDAAYLPIVHLSATFVTSVDKAQGLSAGADSYLTHPADPAVLVATVRALLFARQSDSVRRTSDSRFRAVFQLASSGIALLDSDLVCIDVNPAFCTLAGLTRIEVTGRNVSSLLAKEDRGICADIKESLKAAGHWDGTVPVLRGDGNRADVEWRIVAESIDGTRIAIATDVTERRRAEAERENLLAGERAARNEAERLNRVKDEFLATLSHELRNPLSAILGWVNVLQRTPGVTPEILKGLQVIERNSRLQTHLIADLLDYAGMRFGKMNLDIVAINPAVALQSAHAVVASLAAAKNVTLEWNVADRDSRVMGDDARLQQIVWNLVSNAIKFTPAGGRVTVDGRAQGGQYEISVTDTGRGISAEFLPHIFDRFSQQDSGLNKSFAGLGIGLTIVKHLVEVHSGTIEAHSRGEGHGARFTVRFPLTEQYAQIRPTEAGAALTGLKVLVVEDDRDTRAFIVRILTEAGATVHEAASGDEALAVIESGAPSLLVSDIGMAKQDGYQLIRTVRDAGYTAETLPAIALTAFSRAQDRADAIKAGFQVHLTKPIEADRLTTAIATLAQPKN